MVYRSNPKLLRVRWRLALFRPAWLLRWSLQWRQLWPLLDADADRADLELRLIKLLLKDRARVHPFAGKGGSWRKAGIGRNADLCRHFQRHAPQQTACLSEGANALSVEVRRREVPPCRPGHTRCLTFRISPARSPIMMQGAIVLPVVTRGIMEPSAIRRLSIPWTLREPSTTDIASCPILAVHV